MRLFQTLLAFKSVRYNVPSGQYTNFLRDIIQRYSLAQLYNKTSQSNDTQFTRCYSRKNSATQIFLDRLPPLCYIAESMYQCTSALIHRAAALLLLLIMLSCTSKLIHVAGHVPLRKGLSYYKALYSSGTGTSAKPYAVRDARGQPRYIAWSKGAQSLTQ